jgi:hypothetical protein
MRRSVLTGIAMLSVAGFTAGCEDGPDQPYSPAPANAAQNWNNAGADASTSDPGSQGFDAGGGGTNAINVCNAAQQNAAWTTAFSAPILPPFGMGGIDLSAKNTFANVTIDDVIHGLAGQPELCQGQAYGTCGDGDGTPAYAWGAQNQLSTCYDPSTHNMTFFLLQAGYVGTLSFSLPTTFAGQPVPTAVDDTGAATQLDFVWNVNNNAITLNGQPLTGTNGAQLWSLKYNGGVGGIQDIRANQMYLGLMYTYQPTLIAITDPTANPPLNEMTDPNADCLQTTKCRTSVQSNDGNFGARAVGVYFDVGQPYSTDPATAASPVDLYMYPAKFEPYSLAPYNQGLDSFVSNNADPSLLYNGAPVYGPYAAAGVLSPTGATPFCTLYMGSKWSDFLSACVNVSGNAMDDQVSINKMLGGEHHAAEWFTFNIFGVNQNFSADNAQLTQNGLPGVLQDSVAQPAADSVSTDFILDVRSTGDQLNDMYGDRSPSLTPPACTPDPADPTGLTCSKPCTQTQCDEMNAPGGYDLHGTAAVEGYFRALVIDAIHAEMTAAGQTFPTNLKTCWFDATAYASPSAANKALLSWQAPAGCTGFEQMITPAEPTGTGVYTDSIDKGPVLGSVSSIFKPGDPGLTFVADPVHGFGASGWTTALAAGSIGVGANALIASGNLLQGSLDQVIAVLGHGNIANIPPAARDWRFYLTYWGQAYIAYELNRAVAASGPSGPGLTWQALYNDHLASTHTLKQVYQDQLFFDLQNGIDKFEYIDRTNAAALGSPLDFEYDVLLTSSNVQNFNYYQRLTRAEIGLYSSQLGGPGTTKTDVPGSNSNVNLSDLFGSPAIANAGLSGPASDAMGNPIPGKDAWYCATTLPQDADCPNGPPTDSSGNVLVDGEGRPLFTDYKGVFNSTAFTIGSVLPEQTQLPYIASAILQLPNYADPYDPTSASTPLQTIVPWIPFQAGNGFEIPINGQRMQFVETGSLDFSGVTITTNVDYLPIYDTTDAGAQGAEIGAEIVAVETQDFLGEVWPCVDSVTGDILRVKMYSSVLDIVSWLQEHPGAQTACNIYIRYSPYDNYPDTITSIANGVMINVNPGAAGGPGRVGDATLFSPSLLTQTM